LRLYLSAMCLSKFRNDMGTILHQGVWHPQHWHLKGDFASPC
jgi:hypothetical protein